MSYRFNRTVHADLSRDRIVARELMKLERRREAERRIEGILTDPRGRARRTSDEG